MAKAIDTDTDVPIRRQAAPIAPMVTGTIPVQGGMLVWIPLPISVGDTRHIDVVTPSQVRRISDERSTASAVSGEVLVGFLASLYDLSEQQQVGEGSYLVVKHLDGLLRQGDFKAVDHAFLMADTSRLNPEIAFSFLPITATARGKLDARIRAEFVRRAATRLGETRPSEYVEKLLSRYK